MQQEVTKQQLQVQLNKFFSNLKLPKFRESSQLTKSKQLNESTLLIKKYLCEQQKIYLEQAFKLLDISNDIPVTKVNICAKILKRGQKAYKCYDCLNEDNSILCAECFDLDTHKGHQFERIQVYGGCCDCGDDEKWDQKGFCLKHKSNDIKIEQMNENKLKQFLKEQQQLFGILFMLYRSLIAFKKQQKVKKQTSTKIDIAMINKRIDKIRYRIDAYGQKLFENLLNISKKGMYGIEMVFFLFKDVAYECEIVDNVSIDFGQGTIFQQIFKLTELLLVPERMCDLCISMFPRPSFRKELTILYIRKYNESADFSQSSFNHLSSQLLTSYKVIKDIVQNKLIEPLQLRPNLNFQVQNTYELAATAFVKFYYDINYLAKLFGDSALIYLKFHAQRKKMRDLAYYRQLFNNHPQAINYFGLEHIYLTRMLLLVRIMRRDQTKQIFELTLQDLYEFICNYENKSTNYYFSQQRFFALVSFCYLEGDLDKLTDKSYMKQFLSVIGVKDKKKQMSHLVKVIGQIYSNSSQILQNVNLIEQNYTFYSFYFKKNSLIISLDSIFVKIIFGICNYYAHQQQLQISQTQARPFSLKIQEILSNNPCFQAICNVQIENQNPAKIQFNIKYFTHYISLFSEALYSDLPELVIGTMIDNIDQESNIKFDKLPDLIPEKKISNFYDILLSLVPNQTIYIKQFKVFCEMFFKEEKQFRKFVILRTDDQDFHKLNKKKGKATKYNLIYYPSIKLKLNQKQNTANIRNVPYLSNFYKYSFYTGSNLVECWKNAIQLTKKIGKIQKKISLFSSLTSLVSQLWKFYNLNKSHLIYHYLHELLLDQDIKQYVQAYVYEDISQLIQNQNNISSTIYQQKAQNQKRLQLKSNEVKQIQQKKIKMLIKKKKMNMKIVENQKQFLIDLKNQEESTQFSSDNMCSICKSSQNIDSLQYATFIEEVNTRLFGISIDQTFLIFTGCKHKVHEICYRNANNKKRIYNYCLTCKKPVNFLLPVNPWKQNNEISNSNVWDNMLALRIFMNDNISKELSSLLQEVQRSFILELIIFRFYNSTFFKNECYPILKSIFFLINSKYSKDQNFFKKQIKFQSQNNFFKQMVTYTQNCINQNLSNLKTNFQSKQMSQNAKYQLKKIINSIVKKNTINWQPCENQINIQIEEQESIKQQFLLKLPLNLKELSDSFLGKCPNCLLVTNLQCICLICKKFVTCFKCESLALMDHSKNDHLGKTVFIKASSGQYFYIYHQRYWKFQSLYQDYAFRPYIEAPHCNKLNFNLNSKRLEMIEKDIATFSIEIQVRYKQNEFKIVNHGQKI